jgi:hypothetical protein
MLAESFARPDDMPDILTSCPVTGNAIKTGLATETVRFDTLPPNVPLPIACPHCKKVHFWKPTDSWVWQAEVPTFDSILTGRERTPTASGPIWFVSYEPNDGRPRSHRRVTRRFTSEPDAKKFATARLADATRMTAGTVNPHVPKRVIGSAQIVGWLAEL